MIKMTHEQLQEAFDAHAATGSQQAAAAKVGVSRTTLQCRLKEAERQGYTVSPNVESHDNVTHLQSKVKRLESALRDSQQERVDHAMIKSKIIGLTRSVEDLETPAWLIKSPRKNDSPGVPTLMVSDLHWGEVVDPKQINGVNEYNLEIAHRRFERLAERTIRLLGIISPFFNYPGIVVPLGGDMITGNIHDELTATNEVNSMPAVLDLFETLGTFIETLLTKFPKIFLPCVTGNHGRDTKKIWGKDRHHTSFDWLLYCFLAKHFAKDARVTFFIPDGPDAYYKVYEHRYLLSHGDSFRGGDGIIGPLGPLVRGDHRKRSRNAQINMEYDTLLVGHFHTHMQLTRLIVNGSTKGYDEYAYRENFPYEPPQQALWLTHPKHRITFRMPVMLEETAKDTTSEWVSVEKKR